jgi:hypothetical protein
VVPLINATLWILLPFYSLLGALFHVPYVDSFSNLTSIFAFDVLVGTIISFSTRTFFVRHRGHLLLKKINILQGDFLFLVPNLHKLLLHITINHTLIPLKDSHPQPACLEYVLQGLAIF